MHVVVYLYAFIFYPWYVYAIMFVSSVCMSVISHLSALLVFCCCLFKKLELS